VGAGGSLRLRVLWRQCKFGKNRVVATEKKTDENNLEDLNYMFGKFLKLVNP
jgi:hypothetical protein